MAWTPVDNSNACAQDGSHSGCSPSAMAFVSFLVQYFGKSNDNYKSSAVKEDQNEVYDFVIVGAGSAGCVLANRLSEISNWRVLLLEAGGEEPLIADVPSFGSFLRGSNIDWSYRTQPEKRSCRSKKGKSCGWARGKTMGGSSTINYLHYIRGQPRDYDNWAAMGNPGWSYKDVLPYFKKSEGNRDSKIVNANPEYHNSDGYQTVEYFHYTDKSTKVLIKAWNSIGYKMIDPNANRGHVGAVRYQTTSRDGQRLSTNGAFIRPIVNKRKNLVVRTHAYVTKIIIDPATKTATGVEYYLTDSSNTTMKKATASKEVIISGGSINSPKLLMLSGIGPSKELKMAGISVIKELPVGKNLHDHPTIGGFIIKLDEKAQTLIGVDQMKERSLDYLKRQDNEISAMGTLSAGCFFKTHLEEIPDYPDMQFTFDGMNITDYLAHVQETEGAAPLPLAYYTGIDIRPVLIAPKSRGVLKLNTADPVWGDPLLYPNYFGDSRDLEVILAGIREARKLFETEVFKEHGFELFKEPMPSCKQHGFDSDDYWRCVTMEYTSTIYHFVGTCKMGPRSDPDAVVDAELRVYGIKSLRVVDASIMPVITRGNTNAPTIMIAEKTSDRIKQHWQKKVKENV